MALIALAAAAPEWAQAKDYCCICRGQTAGKAIDADDDFSATLECSVMCKRPTKPNNGACEVAAAPPAPAAPQAPAATQAAVPTPAAGRVLLFKSENCSGDALAVTQSTARLSGAMAGMRSFSVESGGPAAVFEKPDFGGARTERVGPSICVSPGWEIVGVRIGAN
jgi:hypothetical protein